ncbi:MocR-like pyridoxine biosynthesis transcription factor PdxR [Agromyces ramosus]|uniref:GntR family transcriptional regulator/MocR family aminotransferase n=1 Tax=Agromyces ramosus TaxID=33879 RepID=A0ABU0RD89_9MICO|nr:PLP-dependent aminotransferase family protein [Agromyces ramosus]MDQ0896045.1 GntR family transcriptional regulator/MocR family aminotransferase [Agromyces ramosus]
MQVTSIHMVKARTTSSIDELARAGVDLHLELQGSRLRAGLTEALREAVRSGRLAPNTRLPASRALASDLGIARSTVTTCYSELVEEGWLTARHGSGTRVAERVQPRRPTIEDSSAMSRPRTTHVLGPGAVDFAEFPRGPWLAAARRALSAAPHSAFGYGDPLGRMELRSALVDYLARVRGVYADPEQIVITSGFHHGLVMVARALTAQGVGTVAVEGYGLDIYRAALVDEGMSIPPLGVDERGARVDELTTMKDPGAVLLTPAHQFPTGFALSTERRAAVLDWARNRGAFILEDDYDGEFRYDRKPVGSLQGLDPEHVVYFGTASKSVAPALRLAWMVVPESLLPAVAAAKGRVETVSVLDQLIFADFVTSGAFDRHVRGRRHNYRRRRDELIDALAKNAPEIQVQGMAAGLQAVLVLPAGTEAVALRAAARKGLIVSGMAEFRHPTAGPELPRQDALVVNFSSVSDSAWPGALDALCTVLR